MAKISTEIKEQIKALSSKELVEIVIKLAANKDNYNFLLVNYLNKEDGTQNLFEDAKADIDDLTVKRYKGYAEEQKYANMMSTCIKRLNEFTKVSKDKKLEAELILYILEIPFSCSQKMFGTCFTAFDYKVGLLLQRLITLVTKKMHADLLIDYKDIINEYLAQLHKTSNHCDSIYKMPQKIE